MGDHKAPVRLDATLLRAHPLPQPGEDVDKNSRGRVLCAGGSRKVAGGLLLTAEAAFRAGAGKVQMAGPSGLAMPLAMAMPEAAVFALEEDDEGEISGGTDVLCRQALLSDAVVVGPAMIDEGAAGLLVDALLAEPSLESHLVLDAAALLSLRVRTLAVATYPHPKLLTPHPGELQAMLGWADIEIAADPLGASVHAAERFQAVVVGKGATTCIAHPDGRTALYEGGGVGLATGGSGDVLAGIAAGLAARGADAWTAALWAVWLHGEAGRACTLEIGPVGYLARDLLARIPRLMAA